MGTVHIITLTMGTAEPTEIFMRLFSFPVSWAGRVFRNPDPHKPVQA